MGYHTDWFLAHSDGDAQNSGICETVEHRRNRLAKMLVVLILALSMAHSEAAPSV